jgi:arylsulfatase
MSSLPNIVFLMPDQLRSDFLSCYGADFIDTPNIDSLAAEGVLYARAYSASPVCVPARASLLTGLNAIRTGVLDNGLWLRPDLAACGIRTWPEYLNEQGYYTAGVGKMHFYPWDISHGLQYRVIAEDKRWLQIRDDYYHFLRARGHRKYHGNEHEGYYENRGAIVNRLPWELSVDHFVGTEACKFIDTYGGDGPFAMMVGFPGPHCPYDPCQEFLDHIDADKMPSAIPEVAGDTPLLRQQNIEGNLRPWNGVDYTEFTEEQKRKVRAHYAASVLQIDYEVGQILASLRAKGLMDNTVIIFASDHGDYLGDHNLIGKGHFYESSAHVPLVVRPAGGAAAQVHRAVVGLGDVTATILRLGGCEVPESFDSMPLPRLGLGAGRTREIYFGMVAGGWMAFDGNWKLCKYATGEHLLFDLETDPQEQKNLIRDPGACEVLSRLDAALTAEIMRSIVESVAERRVYTVDKSGDPVFGREGWQRPYPQNFAQSVP